MIYFLPVSYHKVNMFFTSAYQGAMIINSLINMHAAISTWFVANCWTSKNVT